MSGDWQKVVGRKQKTKATQSVATESRCMSEEEVAVFLASYKTGRCLKGDFHDPRFCDDFHNEKDQRRNPYAEYYEPDDSLNTLEKIYHPAVFRTTYCDRGHDCPFGDQCSNAHSKEDLRKRSAATRAFESLSVELSVRQARPTVASFISEPGKNKDYQASCAALWTEQRIKPTTAVLELDLLQWFVVQRCDALFQKIEQAAFEHGLGCVNKECKRGTYLLRLKGTDVESIKAIAQAWLCPPSPYFSVEKREYGSRVISSIRELLAMKEGKTKLTDSEDVLLQVIDEQCIRITGVTKNGISGELLVQRVIQKLDFWVEQEGYDTFTQCRCCFENRNPDQGVTCKNGHFYCSVEPCFATAVVAQVIHLGAREEGLICPDCNGPYEVQQIASHLPSEVWQEVHKALIDKEVKQQHEVLAREFDERLEARVQEQFEKYASVSAKLKFEAQREALAIRNTILNLCCPHCKMAYFEFTGCMALQCQTCKGNFCGYCHKACASSMGTHEHVRQCLLNETSNSSYYATEAEVASAQRRYRTRELRKYLSGFKKDLQNAVVIELGRELNDLGIQPAALFEFGNLQGDILPPE